MASSSSAGGVTQLPINLYTRNPSHSIPQSTYFIPADWKRFQLSELINKVLQSTSALESPIPFDFLIDDTLLRTSLEDFVNAHRNGDKESTLNVEYLESLQPPKKLASYPQDDWVSGVNIQRTGCVKLSCCRDAVYMLMKTFSLPRRSSPDTFSCHLTCRTFASCRSPTARLPRTPCTPCHYHRRSVPRAARGCRRQSKVVIFWSALEAWIDVRTCSRCRHWMHLQERRLARS